MAARMDRDTLVEEEQLLTEPKRPDATLGELFGEMTAETGRLIRKEVELVKVEGKEQLKESAAVGGMFAGAAMAGWLALLLGSMALAWMFDRWVDTDVAFLIVFGIWAIVATVMFVVARNRVKHAQKPLPVTTETIKEDISWAKAQKN